MTKFNKISSVLKKEYVYYIIVIIFTIICCMFFDKNIVMHRSQFAIDNPSVNDYYVNIFGGAAILNKSGEKDYNMPFMWLFVQLLFCAIVSLKPFYYSSQIDLINLVKAKSRRTYMLQQLKKVIIQVFLIYSTIIFTIIFYSLLKGNISFYIHEDTFRIVCGINFERTLKLYDYLCPVLYSIMIAIVQLCINMYMNRILSVAAILIYDISAIYIPRWYMVSNISMEYRNSSLVLNTEYSVILCILIIFIAICVSVYRFEKYDIINIGEKEQI